MQEPQALQKTTFFEEQFDPNLEPSHLNLIDQANSLGFYPLDQTALQLARQSLTSPLPSFWKPVINSKGELFYINVIEKYGIKEHPVDLMCKKQYSKRKGMREMKQERFSLERISKRLVKMLGFEEKQLTEIVERSLQQSERDQIMSSQEDLARRVFDEYEQAHRLRIEVYREELQQQSQLALNHFRNQLEPLNVQLNQEAQNILRSIEQYKIRLSQLRPSKTAGLKVRAEALLIAQLKVQSQFQQFRNRACWRVQQVRQRLLKSVKEILERRLSEEKQELGVRLFEQIRSDLQARIEERVAESQRIFRIAKNQIKQNMKDCRTRLLAIRRPLLSAYHLKLKVLHADQIQHSKTLIDTKLGLAANPQLSGRRVPIPERVRQVFRERSKSKSLSRVRSISENLLPKRQFHFR